MARWNKKMHTPSPSFFKSKQSTAIAIKMRTKLNFSLQVSNITEMWHFSKALQSTKLSQKCKLCSHSHTYLADNAVKCFQDALQNDRPMTQQEDSPICNEWLMRYVWHSRISVERKIQIKWEGKTEVIAVPITNPTLSVPINILCWGSRTAINKLLWQKEATKVWQGASDCNDYSKAYHAHYL